MTEVKSIQDVKDLLSNVISSNKVAQSYKSIAIQLLNQVILNLAAQPSFFVKFIEHRINKRDLMLNAPQEFLAIHGWFNDWANRDPSTLPIPLMSDDDLLDVEPATIIDLADILADID